MIEPTDKIGRITLYNADCMEVMKTFKDKQFDLAIVDPPYGINADENAFKSGVNGKVHGFKNHSQKNWDKEIPSKEYFDELIRVSKNQIIWGGNYFTEHLKPVMSWIVWDKMQHNFSFADGELAWCSFGTKLKIFQYARGNESGFAPKLKGQERIGINIHPTQKPIRLYEWLLLNYAKEGERILDTHFGSLSIGIACEKLGFELTAIELDKDYYQMAKQRLLDFKKQLTIEF